MKQAIEQFEQYLKSRYPNSTTAKHYVHDLQLFDRLIGKPPRAVTREDVDRFVKDQLDRELAATTINRRLATLHEFFEYLADVSGDAAWPNPMNWKRHKVEPGKPLPRDVSEVNIERLFAVITQPRDKAMFRLMLDVGLRVGEVTRLKVGDLMETSDGSRGRLRVHGKGNKERFVWLGAETLSIVRAWLEERPVVKDEAMFVTRRKQGFSVRGIEERLTHYCRQVEVKVSPHQLRHTFGRRMAEAEMPVTSLAALMGHAQVSTTQIYIAGAGVKVQADYQAAIEHLQAERLEDLPTWLNGQEEAAGEVATLDVWRLAGVEPSASPAPQPTAKEMDLSYYWEGLPGWLTERLQEYIAYRQQRWKPSQVCNQTRKRLSALRQVWRCLLDEERVSSIADLQRYHHQFFAKWRPVKGKKESKKPPESGNCKSGTDWAPIRFVRGLISRSGRTDPIPCRGRI